MKNKTLKIILNILLLVICIVLGAISAMAFLFYAIAKHTDESIIQVILICLGVILGGVLSLLGLIYSIKNLIKK